jgi:hypothetical protein
MQSGQIPRVFSNSRLCGCRFNSECTVCDYNHKTKIVGLLQETCPVSTIQIAARQSPKRIGMSSIGPPGCSACGHQRRQGHQCIKHSTEQIIRNNVPVTKMRTSKGRQRASYSHRTDTSYLKRAERGKKVERAAGGSPPG